MKHTLGCLGLSALLVGCQTLPSLEGRSDSVRLPADTPSALAAAIRPQAEARRPLSGLRTLEDGLSAFAARVALADMAEHSLDVQYYIWRNDTPGRLMIQRLYQAAERGVRVRVLLDDNNTVGMDRLWAALDMHPNVDVRLFNPFANRRWRALGYVTDFKRLNRRMHNKSFTADNQATIIGGRNIGDEYFDFSEETLFIDLDVLAVGPVVDVVSADFDRYWNSHSAYPLARLVREPAHIARKTQRLFNGEIPATEKAQRFTRAWQEASLAADLQAGRLVFEWAHMDLVSDDPAKVLDQAAEQDSVLTRLDETMRTPERSLWLVSPYFVPTGNGVTALTQLVTEGVDVHVLTNSLAATDVTLVHSGYAPHRPALLAGGVKLYELKPVQHSRGRRDRGLVGSSASSLHAKTFVIDGQRLFIGSFNFDPRSAHLNTEMGLVVHSPSLAQNLSRSVHERLAASAYRLERTPAGKVVWQDTDAAGQTRTLRQEPAPWWRRMLARIAAWLPLEHLL